MKFEKSRFHIEFGPKSLFERVRFKMKDIHELKFTKHSINRCIERKIPMYIIDEILKASERKDYLKVDLYKTTTFLCLL